MLVSPLPTCKAYPIAILLHGHWAIYALLPTPVLYAVNHTILVKAISCKGQTRRGREAWNEQALVCLSNKQKSTRADVDHFIAKW